MEEIEHDCWTHKLGIDEDLIICETGDFKLFDLLKPLSTMQTYEEATNFINEFDFKPFNIRSLSINDQYRRDRDYWINSTQPPSFKPDPELRPGYVRRFFNTNLIELGLALGMEIRKGAKDNDYDSDEEVSGCVGLYYRDRWTVSDLLECLNNYIEEEYKCCNIKPAKR